ncbi:flagellar protein FlaG [Paenibacillus sp. alder61]|uniref:Flagellar protein FlaG n=1 Tax=Paenibacillus faecis TaxID=862114 RepID=A0A5D0CPL2_9BACL|nr:MULTISPECIES: flagellar protein FlaG [Paenibacillus]MCA1293991.1 flagellar protein FlaG [Paenibacillus sp. alder61]TYA11873.1 flagellar protein FlaG [Paenibacillus faecis]
MNINMNRVDGNISDTVRSVELGIKKNAPSLSDNSANINELKAQKFLKEQQEELEKQAKKLNESIASTGKELKFKYSDEAEELYVEIIDSRTKEVLTSLPPEFLIELSVKMKEMIGMFFDKKI